MMSSRIFLFVLLVGLSVVNVRAQHRIAGTVKDQHDQPVISANVVLLAHDSVFVAGTPSDQEGEFVLKKIHSGDYVLKISCLGYRTTRLKLAGVEGDVQMGTVHLQKQEIGLDEVVVERGVRRDVDKQVFFPSARQLRYSTNGITLLQQMSLNRLSVDLMSNSVTLFSGGPVLLCINGKAVTNVEVVALRPEDILRVEYHDRPGIRYAGAAAVVDYITRVKESGGLIALDLTDAPFLSNGQNLIVTKVNYKKSEFGLIYNFTFDDVDNKSYEKNTFRFPDRVLEREGVSEKSRHASYAHELTLNYRNMKKEKYDFNITLKDKFGRTPELYHGRDMRTVGGTGLIRVNDFSRNRGQTPSLDVYFERSLKNDQLFVFNLVGTYFDTRAESSSTYRKNDSLVNRLEAMVNGEKYSVIGQGYYQRAWGTCRFGANVKHNWSHISNHYSGDVESLVDIKHHVTEVGAQFIGKWKRLNFMVGGVGYYNWLEQNDSGDSYFTYWCGLDLQYLMNDHSYLVYSGGVNKIFPSLGALNDVMQSSSDLLWQRGNPNLKPYPFFRSTAFYVYSKDWLNLNTELTYNYKNKGIMGETLFENDYFVQTTANQKAYHRVKSYTSLKCDVWKDYFTMTHSFAWAYTLSQGNAYTHRFSTAYYGIHLTGMYKNWLCLFQLNTSYGELDGEYVDKMNMKDDLMVMYKYKYMALSLGISNFLGRDYKQEWLENRSDLAPSRSWLEGNKNVVFFKLSYTLPMGKQYEASEKKVNNQDSDAGILK